MTPFVTPSPSVQLATSPPLDFRANTPTAPGRLWFTTEFCFYAFLVATVFESVPLLDIQQLGDDSLISSSRIIGYLLLLLCVLNYRACFAKVPSAFVLFAGYYAIGTSSGLMNYSLLDGHDSMLRLWQLPILFLIAANLFHHPQVLRQSLVILAVAGGILATLALTGHSIGAVQDMRVQVIGEERLSVTNDDPNFTAASLGVYLLIITAIAGGLFKMDRVWRWIITPLALPVLVMIVRTGSRGALVGVALGLLVLLLCSRLNWRAVMLYLAVGGISLSLLEVTLHSGAVSDRILRSLDQGDTSGRSEILKASIELLREKPVLGHGLVTSKYALGPLLNRTSRDPHNSFVAAALDAGLVGGGCYLAAFGLCLWACFKSRHSEHGLLLFALLMAAGAFGMALNLNNRKFYWLLLAAAAALSWQHQTKRPASP